VDYEEEEDDDDDDDDNNNSRVDVAYCIDEEDSAE
jgi:hypothetical protein